MEVLPAYDAHSLPVYARHSSSSSSSSTNLAAPPPRVFKANAAYHSGHLEVRLDRRHPSTRFPAYGFNDIVEGFVQVNKKSMTNVVSIVATLEATVTTMVSFLGARTNPSETKKVIPLTSATIYDSSPETALSSEGKYSFSIPFPTYIPGKREPLPPSYQVFHLLTSYQISYRLRIDMVQRGLRRHERVSVPVLYLPRTSPSKRVYEAPKYAADNGIFLAEDAHVTAVDMTSKLHDEHIPTANLILPAPKRFASGETIPVTLTWTSPHSPALTELWSQRDKVRIQLVKRSMIWTSAAQGASVKDIVISEAQFCESDESVEGVSVSRWSIQAGACAQKEASWNFPKVANVHYVIRVSIRPPDGISSRLEPVRHEEKIEITTDLEMKEGGLPAFGLISIGADRPICRV